MEKRWMLPITLLGLSLVVNVPAPAQNTGSATLEPTDQMKKKAAAQKKAAEAKEKWLKAQENTKNKRADLAKAKQEQEQARIAAREAQDAREKLKQPVPSSA